MDLLFQIVEQGGPIPWDSLKLPEGRTRKACTVMIDREKQKVKKAREADGRPNAAEEGGKGTKKVCSWNSFYRYDVGSLWDNADNDSEA
jgi:hypothetical protein